MKGDAIKYTEQEREWVSENRTLAISELHIGFCKTFNRIDVSAVNLNALRKRNGWKTGRSGRFEKGNIPHPNARPKGANKTSFKAGHKPHNWKPVGSTRTSKDGYLEIKTHEPRTWEQVHVLLWTKLNGVIPGGHCVVFKDGDKANISPENLELITRNENLQINRLQCSSKPPEVRPVVRTIGKLTAAIISKTQAD